MDSFKFDLVFLTQARDNNLRSSKTVVTSKNTSYEIGRTKRFCGTQMNNSTSVMSASVILFSSFHFLFVRFTLQLKFFPAFQIFYSFSSVRFVLFFVKRIRYPTKQSTFVSQYLSRIRYFIFVSSLFRFGRIRKISNI